MMSALQRFWPSLFGRGRRVDQSRNISQQAALTVQRDDDSTSNAWSTLSRQGTETCSRSNRRPKDVQVFAGKPHRLMRGAISQFPFRHQLDEYVVDEDISNGRERHKIPALSFKRNDKPPRGYHYVTSHIESYPVYVNRSLVNMNSCNCVGGCHDGKCSCSSKHKAGLCYDSKGRLDTTYDLDAPEVIHECNIGCKCNPKHCKNMVIQGGSRLKVALFRTKSRGWGVKVLEDIKRGSFVGVYSGELITGKDSHKRLDDTYLFNLAQVHIYHQSQGSGLNELKETTSVEHQDIFVSKEEEDQQYVCDARFFGNFTRFINHSCQPNIIGVRSFTEHQDNRVPYISFFTTKDLAANSELTLNYGDNYWIVKCQRDKIYCLCNRSTCRFTKKTLPVTIRQYNKQKKLQQEQQPNQG